MSVRLSCPFCNTGLELSSVPASRRVVCSRCGETFPVRESPDQVESPLAATDSVTPSVLVRPETRKTNRSPLLLIGSGIAAAALVAGIAVYLAFERKDPNYANAGRSSTATVPPAGVAGLAYLPEETSIAITVQAGPLLAYAERKQIDPKKLLVESGVPERLFATLERLGITFEQIHHVFAGLVLAADSAFPRVVLGLMLNRSPADEAAFLKQLKATQYTTPAGATRYKGVDLGIPLPFELARVDSLTYVFASDPRDLESAEGKKGRGSAHLPGGLRESMGRLSPASVAWLATDAAVWEDRPLLKLLEGTKKSEFRKQLQGVRAAAAGLALEPDPTWTGTVRGADSTAVQRLKELAETAVGDPAAGSSLRVDELWVAVEGPGAATWLRNLLPTIPK